MNALCVSWFSAGVSSAVATKLAIQDVDKIIYLHIDDQHEDTLRFVGDCEKWFGKKIEVVRPKYRNVERAILAAGGKGYVNGPGGAACTRLLKRRTRQQWELDHRDCNLTYVWGLDRTELDRAERIEDGMSNTLHRFPLIDENMDKEDAHQLLRASGIKRPAMYDLGYQNNNCVGCVKGGMAYWNQIRIDFPKVFQARAALERRVGHSCIKGVFLDELEPSRGRSKPPIVEECGIFCELLAIKDELASKES